MKTTFEALVESAAIRETKQGDRVIVELRPLVPFGGKLDLERGAEFKEKVTVFLDPSSKFVTEFQMGKKVTIEADIAIGKLKNDDGFFMRTFIDLVTVKPAGVKAA